MLVKSFLSWEGDSGGLLGLGVYTGVSTYRTVYMCSLLESVRCFEKSNLTYDCYSDSRNLPMNKV